MWRTRWVIETAAADDRPVVRVKEEGAGRRWTAEPATWTVAMELAVSRTMGRLTSTKEMRDTFGKVIEVQRREFDYGRRSGRVSTTRPPTPQTDTVTFPLTPDSIGVEMLPTELRVLPEAPGHAMRFELVTREGKVFSMTATIIGRERVSIPAGAFDCYKIELAVPGLRGIAAQLVLPGMFMWHTVAAPHFWVKYQGPDGGVGSKTVTMELVSFAPTPGKP